MHIILVSLVEVSGGVVMPYISSTPTHTFFYYLSLFITFDIVKFAQLISIHPNVLQFTGNEQPNSLE